MAKKEQTDKPVRIVAFEGRNFKRISAVAWTADKRRLVLIGGENFQGKTTILDLICWLALGKKYAPSELIHDGAKRAEGELLLSNGIRIQRRETAKSSSLDITRVDKEGGVVPGGQTTLNDMFGLVGLRLDKILNASDAERLRMLLEASGVDLDAINVKIDAHAQSRKAHASSVKRLEATLGTLTLRPDLPAEVPDVTALQAAYERAIATNQENATVRGQYTTGLANETQMVGNIQEHEQDIVKLQAELDEEKTVYAAYRKRLKAAKKIVDGLTDEDVVAAQEAMATALTSGDAIRENAQYRSVKGQLADERTNVSTAETDLADARQSKIDAVKGSNLSDPQISIDAQDRLTYKGKPWDGMSGAERLLCACAMAHDITPKCGTLCVDGFDAFDANTQKQFEKYLDKWDLYAFATVTGVREDASLTIVDGMVAGD